MKKMTDIPESPRWNMVEDVADYLLLMLDVTLPVNPLELLLFWQDIYLSGACGAM